MPSQAGHTVCDAKLNADVMAPCPLHCRHLNCRLATLPAPSHAPQMLPLATHELPTRPLPAQARHDSRPDMPLCYGAENGLF